MKSLKDVLGDSEDEMSMDSEESEGNLASDLFLALKEGDEEALVDIIKLVMDKCKSSKSDNEDESKGSALLIGLGKK